jgi:DeoR/GlpR family transcriptional regulator of sugar metabolism
MSDYITLEEAGARLGLSPETIRRYIADDKLRGENQGVRALASDVERYERERRTPGRPAKQDED